MAQYTLIDPVTGAQSETSLTEFELTQNLRQDRILLRGREHIGIILHRDLVVFARWCAGEMLAHLKGDPDQSVTHALSLVDRWLEDEKSVTFDELGDAAQAARLASDAARAAWAAEVAWVASDAARAAGAAARTAAGDARFTGVAARTAAWAAQAVGAAAGAAGAAAGTGRAVARAASYKAQAQWFVQHLQSGK